MCSGAKFKMALIPPATILSATSWAESAGTTNIPIFIFSARINFSISFIS